MTERAECLRSRLCCMREAVMDSFKRPCVFLPLYLEIIDLVHEAAWAQIEARDPFRNRNEDG